MAISIRRRSSKKEQALRAAKSTGKKAAKAKVVKSTGKAARKGAGTAAKGGVIAYTFAKARKPLLAIVAIAGGAAVALKLKSSSKSPAIEDNLGPAATAPPPVAQHPGMASAANGTAAATGTPAS